MKALAIRLFYWQDSLLNHLYVLANPALLLARFYVASVFFRSGLTKIQDWESTLFLFNEEYHVPVLPPELAAYLGTGGELALPILLVLGFLSRFSAIGLFIVNLVAANSLSEISEAALSQHILWGTLLIGIAIFGTGKLSVDTLVKRFLS